MDAVTIEPGYQATLHFVLKMDDADAHEVDRTPPDMPVTVIIGDGTLPEGFEKHLLGMKAGDAGEFKIPAAEAFGVKDPANVQLFPRETFPADMELDIGLVIGFSDPSGNEFPGMVTDIQPDQVSVDFNHPLSGHDLIFEVQVLDVKNP